MTNHPQPIERYVEDFGEEVLCCPNHEEPVVLDIIWENNGFTEPDPTHYEPTGLVCNKCGYQA